MSESSGGRHDGGQGDGQDSGHGVTVVVNGREKTVADRRVSFEEVVRLAFNPVPTGDVIFTVTFRNADQPHEGSLVAGGNPVLVKSHGTIFDAQHSNKS